MSIFYKVMYLLGLKPWDTGISPPELKELVEGPNAVTPTRALDLGCGTGTNSVYLAQHGWDVVGIDFVPKAVAAAKSKAAAAGASPTFINGDVTKLGELGVGRGFGLVFDLGCYHSIPDGRRDAYARGVTEATASGAIFLVWGFYANRTSRKGLGNVKMSREELERRFGKDWEVTREWGGEEPGKFPGGWYQLQRR